MDLNTAMMLYANVDIDMNMILDLNFNNSMTLDKALSICEKVTDVDFKQEIMENDLPDDLDINIDNVCTFYVKTVNNKNIDIFKKILELSKTVKLLRHLVYNFIFYKCNSSDTNSGTLARLVYINWPEGIREYLRNMIFNYEEYQIALFLALEKDYNVLFDVMFEINFFDTCPSIFTKAFYHYVVKFGRFDLWERMLQYYQNDWWTPEECIAECENMLTPDEIHLEESPYYATKTRYQSVCLWNPYGIYFQECLVPLFSSESEDKYANLRKIILNRQDFIKQAKELISIKIVIEETLKVLLPQDLVNLICKHKYPKWNPVVIEPAEEENITRYSRNTYVSKDIINSYFKKYIKQDPEEADDDQPTSKRIKLK
jgi:hypothetical protein